MLKNSNVLKYVNYDKAKTSAIRGRKVDAIHEDYFGLFDLISFCDGRYCFHQISTLENKAAKDKTTQAKKKY